MMHRRQFLILACSAVATGSQAQLPPNIQAMRRAAMEEAQRKVTGGARVQRGRVKLDLPPLIDNGNAVPLTVTVESPMTAQDHVKAIHVFTEKNPQPYVISANLGPRAGARGDRADERRLVLVRQRERGGDALGLP